MKSLLVHGTDGKGVVLPTPTLSYYTTGQFTITNYDPNLIYSFSDGNASLLGDKVVLSAANSSSYVYARTKKGLAVSAGRYCERKTRDQYWTVTQASHCDCNGGGCNGGCCGCGTWHVNACMDGGGTYYNGYLACCECGYWSYYNYSGSGYTDTGVEWWKIV